jgi:diacylglycerol kinase (CTP)
MFGSKTPPLPQSLPLPLTNLRIPLPFARRKSTAGFLAGAITGSLVVFGFWTYLSQFGRVQTSLPQAVLEEGSSSPAPFPLALVALAAGLLAGVAEAIGKPLRCACA